MLSSVMRKYVAAATVIFAPGALSLANASVEISKKPTSNISCSGGVCSPTAPNAVLNVNDLANMLASGDLKVTTGSGAASIFVKASVGWASASRLTLDAMQSVEIEKPVMVTGTGAMTVTTNDGGAGGDLIFDGKGNVTFWDLSSSLVVNGNSYTLIGDLGTLASAIASNPSGFYAFANDYDASVDGTYTSAPVVTNFAGTFEGLGHAISGLTINSSDFLVGMFADVNGVLRDINLFKVAITSNASSTAGSLSAESGSAIIVGCSATGNILVATGPSDAGGLIGRTGGGSISRSHANVSVTVPERSHAGGIIGFPEEMTIDLTYATGRVTGGDGSDVGGLLGDFGPNSSVTRSYATGAVTAGANSDVGGLVGLSGASVISNSYGASRVEGGAGSFTGGFVGEIESTVLNDSYSFGHVSGKDSSGFAGKVDPDNVLGPDYWDTDTSGKSRKHGCGDGKCGPAVKGMSTEKLQAGLPAGFDPGIWGENPNINGGLPYLLALPPK